MQTFLKTELKNSAYDEAKIGQLRYQEIVRILKDPQSVQVKATYFNHGLNPEGP